MVGASGSLAPPFLAGRHSAISFPTDEGGTCHEAWTASLTKRDFKLDELIRTTAAAHNALLNKKAGGKLLRPPPGWRPVARSPTGSPCEPSRLLWSKSGTRLGLLPSKALQRVVCQGDRVHARRLSQPAVCLRSPLPGPRFWAIFRDYHAHEKSG